MPSRPKEWRRYRVLQMSGERNAFDRPNWKCYSSGKNPGKHGVYWFERIDLAAERIDVMGGGAVQTEPDRWAAENTPAGMFVANGPDIRERGDIGEVDIRDIAPTILASHGLDIPADMDGEVLDVFVEDPAVGTRDPIPHEEVGGADGDEEVAERLKQLGYME